LHYLRLLGQIGEDWGVCTNEHSPFERRAMFEHDGCQAFERSEWEPGDGAIIGWARRAVRLAADGAVEEENLAHLLGDSYERRSAWTHARRAYTLLLELRSGEPELVLKLIVPLRQTLELELVPPAHASWPDDVHDRSPPMLVIHRPVPNRFADEYEEYRRPLSEHPFPDARVRASYTTFRTAAEDPYSRSLVFERHP
jgi:hypothetical protein